MEAKSPSSIPAYESAVAREAIIRDSAFLCLPEMVAGYELRQMTLRDYLLLRLMASPLLCGATPTPTQLGQFLWALSSTYPNGQKTFLRKCAREFGMPKLPWLRFPFLIERWRVKAEASTVRGAEILTDVREYVSETLMDRPCVKSAKPTSNKRYHSSAVTWCAALAREYGWTEQAILDMPMKRIFQYMNEIRIEEGLPVANPSDSLVAKERDAKLEELNAALNK